MSALAAVAQVQRKDGEIVKHVVAAVKVWEGGMVKQNAAGFLAACAAELGAVFAGICIETVDNSAGAAGDKSARVYKKGIFLLTAASSIFAQTDVGQAVYATDDNNITKTNSADIQRVGVIVEYYSGTQVWVKIDGAVGVLGLEATLADLVTTGVTSSSPFGFVGATQGDAISTKINSILAVLRKHKMISES